MPGEDARDKPVGDALDVVRADLAAEDGLRLGGFHREQPHRRVDRAECLADAYQGAAGAHAHHQCVGYTTLQLRQDLRAEDLPVFLDIELGFELLRREIPGLPTEAPRFLERAVDVEVADELHLGAIRPRDRHALVGQAFRHHHQHPVTLHRRDHRQRVAGVAAGRLDNRVTGLQQALLLGLLDHVPGNARLDRAGGVHELELGEHPVDFEHRGVANGIQDRV